MFQLAGIRRGIFGLGLLGAALEAGSACSASSPSATAVDPERADAAAPLAADGGSGSAEGGGDGGTGSSDTPLGLVLVTQAVTPSVAHSSVSAQFFASASSLPAGCTKAPVAGCVATSCPFDVQRSPRESSLNAGAITVTGAPPTSPATLTFGALAGAGVNGYEPVSAPKRFFSSGDLIGVTGSGGPDLPSFAAQGLVAPNDIVVTAPACASPLDGGACTDVNRASDATIAWTGGGAGKVTVYYITNTDDGSKTVSCDFDAAAGTGVISKAALSRLDVASAPGFHGQLNIIPSSSKSFMVGTLPAALTAVNTATFGTFVTVN